MRSAQFGQAQKNWQESVGIAKDVLCPHAGQVSVDVSSIGICCFPSMLDLGPVQVVDALRHRRRRAKYVSGRAVDGRLRLATFRLAAAAGPA